MSEIKDGQVWINGKPFMEWTRKEFDLWKRETAQLLGRVQFNIQRCQMIAEGI